MTFAITAKNISDCTISKIANEFYTGKALKPGVTVKDGSKPLKKDTDYTVSYKNTKLKKGKTYYYKVRAYRMVDGKKIYGAYSSVESVKMKK